MAIDLTKEYVKLTLDVSTCEINDDFWAKQGDTGRGFIVTLVANNQVIIPLGELVQLHLLKPDGKQVWINGEVKENKFYINLTNQSLIASGKMQGEFLISSRGKTKKSETFIIDVQPSLADGAYESTNEFGDLDILIQKIEQYAPSIESWDTAEQARAYQEGLRNTNETNRMTAETTRVSNENTRVSQENTRKTQETGRTTAESARVTAENTRKSQETARVTAETTRASNETTRQTNETARQTNTSTALTNMQNAYTSTVIIWKASVPSFANIATAYPSPQVGWRVETQDDRKVYRYDGSTWVHIANNSTSSDAETLSNKGVPNGYAPLDSDGRVPVGNLPTTPPAHTHTYTGAVSSVMNTNLTANKILVADANGKISQSSADATTLNNITSLTSDAQVQINSKANSLHIHDTSDVTGLDAILSSIANTDHTHTIENVTGLATELNGKAPISHNHTVANVTGLEDALNSKEPIISGAVSSVTGRDMIVNRAVVSDEQGKLLESDVTALELSYLSGLTENVQAVLDNKSEIDHEHDYLSTVNGGDVNGMIHANGGLTVQGSRVTISSVAPAIAVTGDVWIKI